MTLPPVQPVNPLENLDRHWAVKVVTPEDRASTVRYAVGVLTRLCNGDPPAATEALPDFVVPLAGAYAIAASEWLDFEGAASPTAILSRLVGNRCWRFTRRDIHRITSFSGTRTAALRSPGIWSSRVGAS